VLVPAATIVPDRRFRVDIGGNPVFCHPDLWSDRQVVHPESNPPSTALPTAPPVSAPPAQPLGPTPPELRLVITLMFVNLGLSVLLAVLLLVFHNSVLAFQLAHTVVPPGQEDTIRTSLEVGLWSRLGGVLLIAVLYVLRARALRRGKRSAYRRTMIIAVVGVVGAVFLVLSSTYPAWMRIEEAVQGLVLLALFWAVTRRSVRARFAKPAQLQQF
jgi:hypothetical protein